MGRKRTGEAMLVGVGGVSVTSAERGMARKRRKYTGENEREISQKTSEPGRPQKWGGGSDVDTLISLMS